MARCRPYWHPLLRHQSRISYLLKSRNFGDPARRHFDRAGFLDTNEGGQACAMRRMQTGAARRLDPLDSRRRPTSDGGCGYEHLVTRAEAVNGRSAMTIEFLSTSCIHAVGNVSCAPSSLFPRGSQQATGSLDGKKRKERWQEFSSSGPAGLEM